ncbi:MAG: dipeptidase [Thermoanaerobaculia bacterium]|nr:dipeptidase [Thermoanaerobaculia bacterium]
MKGSLKSKAHTRRLLFSLVALAVVAAVAYAAGRPALLAEVESRFNHTLTPGSIAVSDTAQRLHEEALIVDLHADSLLWGRDLLERSEQGHVDVPRLRRGGVALQVFGLVTQSPDGQNYDRNAADSDRIRMLVMATGWPPWTWNNYHRRALHQLGRLAETVKNSDGALRWIESRRDLQELVAARRAGAAEIGVFGGLEGAHAAANVKELKELHSAGLRMLGLAHFIDNPLAGSAHGVDKYGLTEEGRVVVREAQRLGIVVDLAHASKRTVRDVLELATRPVVVSHGGVRGTCPGSRTLSDSQLRGIAATGGVVGIGFFEGAVCGSDVPSIVRAIRYAIRVAGADHVALGSDFDGSVTTPFDASGLPVLTEALLESGLPAETVRKVLGENALRVFSEALP